MKGDSTVSGLEATSQRTSVGSTDAPDAVRAPPTLALARPG
jgi:hypothetical protein